MARVVSVTSIPVERDSRAFKFAASVARLGHESVVVERQRSRLSREALPFRLISPPALPPASPATLSDSPEGERAGLTQNEAPPHPGMAFRAASWVTRRLPGPAAEALRGLWDRLNGLLVQARRSMATARGFLDHYSGLNRETHRMLPPADAYWLHTFWQGPSVYLKARRQRARFLYDAHDALWERGTAPEGGGVTRAAMRAYEAIDRFCARRARAFTTASDGQAELLERRFGRRPLVIRNCHDPRLDRESTADVREVAGLGSEEFLLVMTGNRKPGMTVREALLALKRLPEQVHIAFVGGRHQASREMAAGMGLSGRAHFPGPVAPTEVVGFIATADASPILYQPVGGNDLAKLPNGFFHAVAAGLPLLYPPLPEISALAGEHGLGIEFDPASPESIRAAVTTLKDDPESRAAYAASAEKAREVLNWEREEEIIAEVLTAASLP